MFKHLYKDISHESSTMVFELEHGKFLEESSSVIIPCHIEKRPKIKFPFSLA